MEVGKKVEVRITEKMLVVVSPGGLRGLSASQLESPELTKAPVNKRLYEIARYLRTAEGERVIEGEGGGIQEILTATREAGLPKPRFIDNGVSFKVLFPRGSRFTEADNQWLSDLKQEAKQQFTPTEEDILINLRSGGGATLSHIVQLYTPLGERKCKRILDRLIDCGVVELEDGIYSVPGERKEITYRPDHASVDQHFLVALGLSLIHI